MPVPVRSFGPATTLLFRLFLLPLFLIPLIVAEGVSAAPTAGQPSAQSVLDGVVRVQTRAPADARSARTLGTERDGSGIVIDDNGLVLTVGYLLLETEEAEIGLSDGRRIAAKQVAYDHETGFGLLRAQKPLGVKPIEMGLSDGVVANEQVLVVAYGGQTMAMPAMVVSRRPFAGPWEYMLDNAIFTSPPHPSFGGAALLTATGKLIGVGSLIVGDAAGPEEAMPGNMFIPIDMLKPILADLLDSGRSAGPRRPWLGLYSEEIRGRLFVTRVAPGGPAEAAGIAPGDMVVGVDGKPVSSLTEFYRTVWALGPAGIAVPLDVLKGVKVDRKSIKSGDRYDWIRRRSSY